MGTSANIRRTCAIAVLVSCVFTVTVLPSKAVSPLSRRRQFRKGLEDPTFADVSVRQPEDRTTLAQVQQGSLSNETTASAAKAAEEQTFGSDDNVTDDSTVRAKLSISLKKVVHQNVQEAVASTGLVYVPPSLPQNLAEQHFVDNLPAINEYVRSSNFTAKQAAALHAKR